MKSEELKDEFKRNVALCCAALRLDQEKFMSMTLDEQIGYTKAIIDIKVSEDPKLDEIKKYLLNVLNEKRDNQFEKDIEGLLKIVNRDNEER